MVSGQHSEDVSIQTLRDEITNRVILPTIPAGLMDRNTKIYINPTGRFVVGGPAGDSGLTGRKLIVDTYGGYARHGGGSFSGKDVSKVDRTGAYMAAFLNVETTCSHAQMHRSRNVSPGASMSTLPDARRMKSST